MMSIITKSLISISLLATPCLANESYFSIGYGSSTYEIDGYAYLDSDGGNGGNGISLYSRDAASLSGPQFSYSRKIDDIYTYSLSYSSMEGDGVQRDEVSISLMRPLTSSLSGAVGIYNSKTDISHEMFVLSPDAAIDNLSLFGSLQTNFPLGQTAFGFARISYQMGDADITSEGKTSPTEPSGASFSFGGMMPIGNNNFFELSYDIKDIEYENTLADGGSPEEDFTSLRAAFSMQF
jgi:hypothetical protein